MLRSQEPALARTERGEPLASRNRFPEHGRPQPSAEVCSWKSLAPQDDVHPLALSVCGSVLPPRERSRERARVGRERVCFDAHHERGRKDVDPRAHVQSRELGGVPLHGPREPQRIKTPGILELAEPAAQFPRGLEEPRNPLPVAVDELRSLGAEDHHPDGVARDGEHAHEVPSKAGCALAAHVAEGEQRGRGGRRGRGRRRVGVCAEPGRDELVGRLRVAPDFLDEDTGERVAVPPCFPARLPVGAERRVHLQRPLADDRGESLGVRDAELQRPLDVFQPRVAAEEPGQASRSH